MTNGDKIRAMNDEELADYMMWVISTTAKPISRLAGVSEKDFDEIVEKARKSLVDAFGAQSEETKI